MSYYTSIMIITWIGLGILAILIQENNRIRQNEKKTYYTTCTVIAAAALCEWIGVHISGNPNNPK